MSGLNNKNTYWLQIPILDSLLKKLLNYNRYKIHNIFLNETEYSNNHSLLDVGTTNSLDKSHNIILQRTTDNKNIYCLSDQDLSNLKQYYRNIKQFIKDDGRGSKLNNQSVDIVFSSATIEHVGSFENQVLFVKEAFRLAKKTIFLTTPNRYYPIDFHTKLPFIHWLPKNIHRKILKFIGLGFYASEENLNLLDKNSLKKIMHILNIKKYKIINFRFIFFTSNYIIIINK